MRSNGGKGLGSGSSGTTVIALTGDAGWTRCQKTSLLGELERASLGLSLGRSGVFGVSERQIFRERTDSREGCFLRKYMSVVLSLYCLQEALSLAQRETLS